MCGFCYPLACYRVHIDNPLSLYIYQPLQLKIACCFGSLVVLTIVLYSTKEEADSVTGLYYWLCYRINYS